MKSITAVSSLVSCFIFISLLVQYSAPYQHLTTENDDLCSHVKKRTIKLLKDKKSALIVTQTRMNDHSLWWESNLKCKFQLQLGSWSSGGIIAVIQHLSFRKNTTTDECIDYVQFMGKDGSSSRKFCGKFNAALRMDKTFVKTQDAVASGNAFVDKKGEMDVYIFVSREPLRPEEEIDLNIVFTAYHNCPWPVNRDDEYHIKPCTSAREYCIHAGFFNDTFINCPSPECVDEMGCSSQMNPEISSSSDQIFYGALSSVFISFFIFVLCILIIRAKQMCCFDQGCYQSRSRTVPPPPVESRIMELGGPVEAPSQSQLNPTASGLEEDKDLPPSYDALFPSSEDQVDDAEYFAFWWDQMGRIF